MNIAIVDDEENIRNLYKKYCEEWANINKIHLKTELFHLGKILYSITMKMII